MTKGTVVLKRESVKYQSCYKSVPDPEILVGGGGGGAPPFLAFKKVLNMGVVSIVFL